MFDQLRGNEAAKRYLCRMVERDAIANSLLFAGPDGIGKSRFALALAALTFSQNDPNKTHVRKVEMGNHPDLHIYRPEGKLGLHSIASLRQLADEVHLAPYEAKWKVFIVHEAERMLSYSANALLKTFEEPTPNTLIILLSSAPELLIPTVLSRCRVVRFHPLSQQEIVAFLQERYPIDDATLQALAFQSHGSLSRAIHLAEHGGDPNREFLLNILSQGKFTTYKALTQAVETINERIEERKKLIEEAVRQELNKIPEEGLTATQKQTLEKEVEGLVSTQLAAEAAALFAIIQSWYRDLHLLQVNGSPENLFNRDYIALLQRGMQQGALLALEEVEKAIKAMHLALQRSTSLTICLENLFLKLQLL